MEEIGSGAKWYVFVCLFLYVSVQAKVQAISNDDIQLDNETTFPRQKSETDEYLPTTALSSTNFSIHPHNLACTSFAFSRSGLMFSGVIASFQSSRKEGEGEGMAGIFVDNTGPRAGDENMMGGEADKIGRAHV